MDLGVIRQATEGLLGGLSSVIGKFKVDPTRAAELEKELQQAVLAHEQRVLELAAKELEMAVQDKSSAREREVSLRNTIGVWVQNMSAIVVIVAFIGLLYVSFFYEGEVYNRGIVDIMIGSLGTIVVSIFSYWFGSSQGSANKETQIREMMRK